MYKTTCSHKTLLPTVGDKGKQVSQRMNLSSEIPTDPEVLAHMGSHKKDPLSFMTSKSDSLSQVKTEKEKKKKKTFNHFYFKDGKIETKKKV